MRFATYVWLVIISAAANPARELWTVLHVTASHALVTLHM